MNLTVNRPKTISAAVGLMALSWILIMVQNIYQWDELISFSYPSVIVMSLILTTLFYFSFGLFILLKKNWSRFILAGITVFGLPMAIMTTIDLYSSNSPLFTSSVIQIVLQLSVAVLLFLPDSTRWFKNPGPFSSDNSNPAPSDHPY